VTTDVLVVEDDTGLREALADTLGLAGYRVQAACDGEDALRSLERASAGLVVSDVQMRPMDGVTLLRRLRAEHPELPVLLMTAYGTIQQAVEAMREGAADYLVKPFEAEVLVAKVAQYLRPAAGSDAEVIAEDPASRSLLTLAARVAESEATVLLTGESGTGKEVLARFIHRRSRRAAGPFVAINCAAIPDNMLEAVLFGYDKGAFTGAYRSSPGKFEQAQGGTLLLDEISEMSLPLQAKLLRVLQEREVERLGGQGTVALDVRVLATSNRDLRAEVVATRFREDLYYRLNVFPLHLPALRERPGDVLPLTEHLLGRLAAAGGPPAPALEPSARERLLGHAWPGNVRELGNVLQRALILCQGGRIGGADLVFEAGPAPVRAQPQPTDLDLDAEPVGLGDALRRQERERILTALAEERGNRALAAARLGISPRTLRHKLQRMRESEGDAVGSRGGSL
jgi:two-component system response regulator FlrC